MNRLVSEDELAKTAFALWAASTARRYFRMVRSSMPVQALSQLVHTDPSTVDAIVARVRDLIPVVARGDSRTLDEVELGVLLAALERTATRAFEDISLGLAVHTAPTLVWVSALARDALARRASNMSRRARFSAAGQTMRPVAVRETSTPRAA